MTPFLLVLYLHINIICSKIIIRGICKMLLYKDIIKEGDSRLREKCDPVSFPLTNDDIKVIEDLNEYLINGYDDKIVDEYDLRPGVGIAAPQIGVLKQIFLILSTDEKGNLHHYAFLNPKIISHSEEKAFIPSGEGCLSVEREVEGLIHRSKRITASVFLYDFNTKKVTKEQIKLKDYIAIVFQHEFDHLNGVLFVDRIDKTNPYFIPENSKPIVFDANNLEGDYEEKGN